MAKKVIKKAIAKKSNKPKSKAKTKSVKKSKVGEVVSSIEPLESSAPIEVQVAESIAEPVVEPIIEPVASTEPLIYLDQWRKDHIAKHNITHKYFHLNGGIYRTSDGKPFANPEEFMADGGQFTNTLVHGL